MKKLILLCMLLTLNSHSKGQCKYTKRPAKVTKAIASCVPGANPVLTWNTVSDACFYYIFTELVDDDGTTIPVGFNILTAIPNAKTQYFTDAEVLTDSRVKRHRLLWSNGVIPLRYQVIATNNVGKAIGIYSNIIKIN